MIWVFNAAMQKSPRDGITTVLDLVVGQFA